MEHLLIRRQSTVALAHIAPRIAQLQKILRARGPKLFNRRREPDNARAEIAALADLGIARYSSSSGFGNTTGS